MRVTQGICGVRMLLCHEGIKNRPWAALDVEYTYDRTGTLWEGRYKATLLDSEQYHTF